MTARATRQLRREHLDRERVLSAYRDRLAAKLDRDPGLGRAVAESAELPPGRTHDPITGKPRESERARKARERRRPGGRHQARKTDPSTGENP